MDFSTFGYICNHSHFYRVLSENPWFEAVELQESAYPCHDWNERVTADCYAPSAAVGFLDGENQKTNIVSNYAGSALTSVPGCSHGWVSAPRVNRASLDAVKESRERFSGYGSPMVQAYNHVILHLTRVGESGASKR